MRYSLVSRFRGTLLGAMLGEALAQGGKHKFDESGSNFAQAIIPGSESLIKLGKLDFDDWRKSYQKEFFNSDTTENITSKIIFATIPIALFFHENPVKLRQNLLEVVRIWDNDPVTRDCTLAVGYAIAQSLTEKLHPQTIIPQTISFMGETQTLLPQNLLKINQLLEQRAGLAKLHAELSKVEKLSYAIAVAFYCFLSTLEDFRLTVLRSSQSDFAYLQTIMAITGALSGSYNSTVGIPINWQVSLSPTHSISEQKSQWQMLQLTDSLAAVWSGVYNPPLHPRDFLAEECVTFDQQLPLLVYAAPRVIRGR